MLQNDSYFGGFITSTFADVYPDVDTFVSEWDKLKEDLTFIKSFENDSFIKKIFYILAAEYAFSHHIGSRDQFKLMMFARIAEYGPYLERELEVQRDLMTLDNAALREGSKAIYNTAMNPGTEPSATSLEELQYINSQNTTNYKKSKTEGYAVLLALLDKNLIKDFVDKFRNLFISVCYPDHPLWYANDPDATVIVEGGPND